MQTELFYRPNEFDDWGVIRSKDGKIFASVRRPLDEDEARKHRAAKTDPFEPLARRLIASFSSPAAVEMEALQARTSLVAELLAYAESGMSKPRTSLLLHRAANAIELLNRPAASSLASPPPVAEGEAQPVAWREATAVCDAFDVLSLSEAYGGSGATSVSSKDLNALDKAVKALRAALSSVPGKESIGQAEIRSALLNAHAKAGSYAALAKEVGLSDEYVRQCCHGARRITGKLLTYLGYVEQPSAYAAFPGSFSPAPAVGEAVAK